VNFFQSCKQSSIMIHLPVGVSSSSENSCTVCVALKTVRSELMRSMRPVHRMQRDNAVLRQHVLDLRRAVRAVGCDLNASATFFPLPARPL